MAPRLVQATNHVYRSSQSRARGCFAHQSDNGFQRVKQHPATGTSNVGKQTTFNRIVFRAIAGVMSHADFKADGVGQRLQVMFENVRVRGVAAAAITQQKER